MGIIGRNGAGKSTLLKVLSRVTTPTKGSLKIKGRIASLLEVGTGFHPEMTGRENIFMNGAILGMTKKEIASKFDEIVDFAGVQLYVDTPVKRYSSGMYVRLAFAVAAHLEPEILIVDEVLAVGDMEFQKKCLGKLKDVNTSDGRTVLFVSHNMAAIQSLCSKSILMKNGSVEYMGQTGAAIDYYLNNYKNTSGQKTWELDSAPGDHTAKLLRVEQNDVHGNVVSNSFLEDDVYISVYYRCLEANTKLNISLTICTDKGEVVFASPSNTDQVWCGVPHPEGTYKSFCKVPGNLLNEMAYRLDVLLVKNSSEIAGFAENAITIEKIDSGKNRNNFYGTWIGTVRPILEWTTVKYEN